MNIQKNLQRENVMTAPMKAAKELTVRRLAEVAVVAALLSTAGGA
jgi:hypothetical protein